MVVGRRAEGGKVRRLGGPLGMAGEHGMGHEAVRGAQKPPHTHAMVSGKLMGKSGALKRPCNSRRMGERFRNLDTLADDEAPYF